MRAREARSGKGSQSPALPPVLREAGPTAIDEFTYVKTMYVDYSGRLQKAQIDTEKLSGS